ncbi:hypothetical protein [Algoriphagus antarcticus]|uniref:hypothetical protein n=1 Tax=Algoriphagus antarcticus TaxID=238540 RepID=UPI000A37A39E|nr:hypothetical protein [Algoriphagus antarcticus]
MIFDSKQEFDQSYLPIIQSVIEEAGFPHKLGEPISTIYSMKKADHHWNRKLMELELTHRIKKWRLRNIRNIMSLAKLIGTEIK